MQLTVATWDDRVIPVEVDPQESIETLKAILEAESGLDSSQQMLVLNGNPVAASSGNLSELGITDGALLMLMPRQQPGAAAPQQAQQGQQAQRQAGANHPALQMNADGSAAAPAAFIQTMKANPTFLHALEANNPTLADLIKSENVEGVQEELRRVHQMKLEQEAALKAEQELLMADPFDIEAQRKIEELIQQKNIEENLAHAYEHNPEVFGTVSMLYVDMDVNGVPVKAFVDSGAQMTIMTYDFAEKCYLTRLIDKRYQGMAVGVGSSKIIGRIHAAPLKVAGNFITSSITVLEQKDGPQFIFGLDMLRRHQCCIDLAGNVLRIGSADAILPFLPEHEIPKDFKRHIEEVSQQDAEKSMADAKRPSDPDAAGPSTSSQATPMDVQPSSAPAPAAAPAAPSSTPAPAAPAAPAPPAQPPAPRAPALTGVSEEALQGLMSMGFTREQSIQALQAANGNADLAASMLFGGF